MMTATIEKSDKCSSIVSAEPSPICIAQADHKLYGDRLGKDSPVSVPESNWHSRPPNDFRSPVHCRHIQCARVLRWFVRYCHPVDYRSCPILLTHLAAALGGH